MKFINLLKKEIVELMNAQMILGMAVTLAILAVLGGVLNNTVTSVVEETTNVKIIVSDRDQTDFTHALLDSLDAEVKLYETEGDDYAAILKDNNINNLVIIPEGFTESVKNGEKPEVITVSRMASASAVSSVNVGSSGALNLIAEALRSGIASRTGLSEEQYALMSSPISVTENTVVADKSAEISTGSVMSKVMMQNIFLPIVVCILILLTSQTLIASISNEKIDKTLETLLSTPISRGSVIGAKMLAAAIVAMINAVVYMLGFSVFISDAANAVNTDMTEYLISDTLSVENALVQLGLSLTAVDYLLVGVQLFITILICLSVSIILGALANDTKSSQTLITPIMLLAMIPYVISMAADINALPTVIKYVVYAIPFTHTFSAMSNLMFGNTMLFFGGLVYQVVIFVICIFFALKLFKSDKIFTISLNFGQKSKFKKSNQDN